MASTLTDQDDGKQVRAHVGDILEVHLAGNPTTGYRWEPDTLDPHQFALAGAAVNPPSAVVGSGAGARFQVKVLAAGRGTLRFKYWRPWEGEAGVVKRFTVAVEAS